VSNFDHVKIFSFEKILADFFLAKIWLRLSQSNPLTFDFKFVIYNCTSVTYNESETLCKMWMMNTEEKWTKLLGTACVRPPTV